jgi:transcriptional regulator with GAF, ATPase, and Fis domain
VLCITRPQHIDFAIRLLGMMLEAGLRPVNTSSPTERDVARRDQLENLLREHHGNVSEVARVMEKARNQIDRWIKRYELNPDIYRGG